MVYSYLFAFIKLSFQPLEYTELEVKKENNYF